jgi:hypothetical protein
MGDTDPAKIRMAMTHRRSFPANLYPLFMLCQRRFRRRRTYPIGRRWWARSTATWKEPEGRGACRGMTPASPPPSPEGFLKPMDLKQMARVPYTTVITWLTVGHPRAGILPSIDLGGTGKRHSYRVRREDWEAFLARLQTASRERQRTSPPPRPSPARDHKKGMFRY